MDLIVGIAFSFFALIFFLYKDFHIEFSVLICFFIFFIIALKRGYSFKSVLKMAYEGGKKSLVVAKVLILIGIITASWMASGTVQSIVYYGIKIINPDFFIVYTFLICTVVSYMLGTAFGTVGTVGVALMVMAKGGNLNPNIVSGAIISGAYFGDRCSPMSSSAHLVRNLTDTDIYSNIKNMVKTSIIPFIVSFFIYFIISLNNPLKLAENNLNFEIEKLFTINFLMLLPAIVILLLSCFKVNVNKSMILSIVTACIIAMFIQKVSFYKLVKYIIFGYKIDKNTFLKNILKGGGILSMAKSSFLVLISCGLAGIIESSNMLDGLYKIFNNISTHSILFLATLLVSIIVSSFGGNQSIAIVLTAEIMRSTYEKLNISNSDFAVSIENTAVVLSPFIPWNIGGLIPTRTLNISSVGYQGYAFYLYLIPVWNLMYLKIKETGKRKAT